MSIRHYPLLVLRMLVESIALAAAQFRAYKLRSTLAITGIMIAVAGVTVAAAALTGLRAKVLKEIEFLGTTTLWIYADRPDTGPRSLYPWSFLELTSNDFAGFLDRCPSIECYSRMCTALVPVSNGRWTIKEGDIIGVDEGWHKIWKRSVTAGRELTFMDVKEGRQVCLIPEEMRERLHLPVDCIGSNILIAGRSFTIVGIIAAPATFEMLNMPSNYNLSTDPRNAILPFTSIHNGADIYLMDVMAKARSTEQVQDAVQEATTLLRRTRDIERGEPDTFGVYTSRGYLDTFNEVSGEIMAATIAVVSVSLLVGGIGVMNVMLVSVSARTREIGLRKALGAQPAAVLVQFLVEAMILALTGGLLGLGAGAALTAGMRAVPSAHLDLAHIPVEAAMLSLAVAAGTGILFGMFPAARAACMDPVRALRHE